MVTGVTSQIYKNFIIIAVSHERTCPKINVKKMIGVKEWILGSRTRVSN